MSRIPIVGGDSYTTEVDIDLSGVATEATAEAARDAALDAATDALLAATRALEIQGGRHGYPERELLYWPCMSGERFAPTLGSTGNPVYTRYQGWPCIRWDTNISDVTAIATYPYVPRTAPGKPVLHFRFKWARDNNLSEGIIDLLPQSSPDVFRLRQINNSATCEFKTGFPSSSVETTNIANAFPLGDFSFKDFEITLTETEVTVSINGVVVATHVTEIWPSTLDATPRLILRSDSSASSAYKSLITLIEMEYAE